MVSASAQCRSSKQHRAVLAAEQRGQAQDGLGDQQRRQGELRPGDQAGQQVREGGAQFVELGAGFGGHRAHRLGEGAGEDAVGLGGVGRAPPAQQRRAAARRGGGGQFPGQPALAHAGLAGHHDQAASAVCQLLQGRGDGLPLGVPSDHDRGPRQRHASIIPVGVAVRERRPCRCACVRT
jgi:hypothetical protein